MSKTRRNIFFILVPSIIMLVVGVFYFSNFLSRAYSPPNVVVTKNEIISSGGFMDPVSIEKLKVDAVGESKRPTKYTIEYIATCHIKQKDGELPVALDEIILNVPGRYSWSEENVHISIVHPEGVSKRIDTVRRSILSMGHQNFSICPIKFEKGNWYFINFGDPIFIGVYVYIDQAGTLYQYAAYSGKPHI
jgi:hypothetical protein